jgi:hypothetical protein
MIQRLLWLEYRKMFDDFSYLYEHRYTWDAYVTYFGICLWVAAVRVAIVGVVLLLIGIVISPILIFYFGIDLFHAKRKDEQKRVKRAKRTRHNDSRTDTYIKKLDLAAAKRK